MIENEQCDKLERERVKRRKPVSATIRPNGHDVEEPTRRNANRNREACAI